MILLRLSPTNGSATRLTMITRTRGPAKRGLRFSPGIRRLLPTFRQRRRLGILVGELLAVLVHVFLRPDALHRPLFRREVGAVGGDLLLVNRDFRRTAFCTFHRPGHRRDG